MNFFFRYVIISWLTPALFGCNPERPPDREVPNQPPNFLVLMSDNQYYSHLGCYGDPIVKTPNIDLLATQGVRFTHAFCASPSCTPARGAMLAGQDIWRLGEGGNLWSTLSDTIPLYTDLLEKAGYLVGHDRKGWGPGNYEAGGRTRNPAGYTFTNFEDFLEKNKSNRPWSFWLSSRNPHRPFECGAGIANGIDPKKVIVPPYLPDSKEVRADMCDYYYQIRQFDNEVAEAVSLLKEKELDDNTVIIVCSDNGWMMPRGLANLYDFGTRVPLIISWPEQFKDKKVLDDFVSLNDLAPTILELARIQIPKQMTAKSLVPLLSSDNEGYSETERNYIIFGRERHALVRKGGLGYPGRAIRTRDYLYIHNLTPERWPAGDPPLFGDIDLHMLQDKSPTKEHMMLHKDSIGIEELYKMAFLKRPEEELFDLKHDPYQMKNVAYESNFEQIKADLKKKLHDYLVKTQDPRAIRKPAEWDNYPYYKESDWVGIPRPEAQKKFGLKEAYSYR